MDHKIDQLVERIIAFRNARDWKQFHNPKDLAISLALEAAEVMEHFQWKNKEEMEKHIESHRKDIGEELADVLYWVLLMGHDMKIDVLSALDDKMTKTKRSIPLKKQRESTPSTLIFRRYV